MENAPAGRGRCAESQAKTTALLEAIFPLIVLPAKAFHTRSRMSVFADQMSQSCQFM
jgi:hypothetical protein